MPAGDPWFDPSGTGTLTISMSRSEWDPASGTGPGNPRQQLNEISSFIDGSQIYGVDAVRAAALREFSGGRLKTTAGDLLPLNTAGLANANDAHRVADDRPLDLPALRGRNGRGYRVPLALAFRPMHSLPHEPLRLGLRYPL